LPTEAMPAWKLRFQPAFEHVEVVLGGEPVLEVVGERVAMRFAWFPVKTPPSDRRSAMRIVSMGGI
jgi:hypothetical protein